MSEAGLLLEEAREQIVSGLLLEEDFRLFLELNTAQRAAVLKREQHVLPCYEDTNGECIPVPKGTTEKFTLLVDLGVITVPDDYDHPTALENFMKKNREEFDIVNKRITDANFPNPTRVLKPGDKLRVRAFKQVAPGTTTSEERLVFLSTQKAIHTGAQGASLVFEQKRDELPKGKRYMSFDEKDRLWTDAHGFLRVPRVDAHPSGDFDWDLDPFMYVSDGNAFFCFNEVDTTEGQTC